MHLIMFRPAPKTSPQRQALQLRCHLKSKGFSDVAAKVLNCVLQGGNRTENGMKANSILFTIKLADKINGRSFYDRMIRAASASGDR